MPLYELVCIARASANSNQDLRRLLKISALHVMNGGGVVRSFEANPLSPLPYRMRKHQEIYDKGITWFMRFDASPHLAQSLLKSLDFDERVIRSTVIKVGSDLK
ncbi:30S ribosomal protein S6, partial [Blyttiomyces helicus]